MKESKTKYYLTEKKFNQLLDGFNKQAKAFNSLNKKFEDFKEAALQRIVRLEGQLDRRNDRLNNIVIDVKSLSNEMLKMNDKLRIISISVAIISRYQEEIEHLNEKKEELIGIADRAEVNLTSLHNMALSKIEEFKDALGIHAKLIVSQLYHARDEAINVIYKKSLRYD